MLALIETIGAALVGSDQQGDSKDAIQPAVVDSHELATAAIAGIGGDILVVDDDPMNRELLCRRLVRGGYNSTAVASGKEALALLGKRRFDLVLLDYMMPEFSGLETLHAIKENPKMRAVPIIMLSASDASDIMVRCILSGAEDYIAKPFNPVLLIARINGGSGKDTATQKRGPTNQSVHLLARRCHPRTSGRQNGSGQAQRRILRTCIAHSDPVGGRAVVGNRNISGTDPPTPRSRDLSGHFMVPYRVPAAAFDLQGRWYCLRVRNSVRI